MGTNQYDYVFDNIGNRDSYTNNGAATAYDSNPLNQYTNITGSPTTAPTHDADGNMLTYGDWAFTWNGENRLVTASNSVSSTVVSNAYDYMGRRYSKTVDGVETLFVYDGWNLIQETSDSSTNMYVWGLDLSGSMQGAGGIGGLLVTVDDGTAYYSFTDANGNVSDYVDASGTSVAHYDYSPFGQTIASSGAKKDDFSFRFSTKYLDETGLYYYGYRFYDPVTGRWPSRDPIGERGGYNVYAFVVNSPVNLVDPFGLSWWNPFSWFRNKDKYCTKVGGTGTDDKCCCKDKVFDPKEKCCDNGKVVDKVAIYVINRGGPNQQGSVPGLPEWTGGHIDMIVPGCGMIGFFGQGDGTCGMGMDGYFNETPGDWWRLPPLGRPPYVAGPGGWVDPRDPQRRVQRVLNVMCELKVCPQDTRAMCDKFKDMKADPPGFNIVGGNCASRACQILDAGGVDAGHIGFETPQGVIERIEGMGGRCFQGFTGMDPRSGDVYIWPYRPGPWRDHWGGMYGVRPPMRIW